jgi:hypothetical protein
MGIVNQEDRATIAAIKERLAQHYVFRAADGDPFIDTESPQDDLTRLLVITAAMELENRLMEAALLRIEATSRDYKELPHHQIRLYIGLMHDYADQALPDPSKK